MGSDVSPAIPTAFKNAIAATRGARSASPAQSLAALSRSELDTLLQLMDKILRSCRAAASALLTVRAGA